VSFLAAEEPTVLVDLPTPEQQAAPTEETQTPSRMGQSSSRSFILALYIFDCLTDSIIILIRLYSV
jgi:hypothetical protein